MSVHPQLHTESLLETPMHTEPIIEHIRVKGDDADDAPAPLSTSAQGVSTTSPSMDHHPTPSSSRLGASKRSVALSSTVGSADGVYGPSTFGALNRFKSDPHNTPQNFFDPKPLPAGRQSSFSRAPRDSLSIQGKPRALSPAEQPPGPGSYDVRKAVENSTTSNFRRTPSICFSSRRPTEWLMLKSGMQVAVLSASEGRRATPPRTPSVDGGAVDDGIEKSRSARPSPRKESPLSRARSAFFPSASRFPKSETDVPGPGAYGGDQPTLVKPPKAGEASKPPSIGESESKEERSRSAPRHQRGTWSQSPGRAQSPRPCSPGPGAYALPTTFKKGSARTTFPKAERESNQPIKKPKEGAAGTEASIGSRPLINAVSSSWVQTSTNAFFRRSQEDWVLRQHSLSTSRPVSRASTPGRAASMRSSLHASPPHRGGSSTLMEPDSVAQQ